jgi:hypothetical protein
MRVCITAAGRVNVRFVVCRDTTINTFIQKRNVGRYRLRVLNFGRRFAGYGARLESGFGEGNGS